LYFITQCRPAAATAGNRDGWMRLVGIVHTRPTLLAIIR